MSKPVCQRCKSDNIIGVNGQTSDCCSIDYKGKEVSDGYVIGGIGIGDDSDCIIIEYCADCGQLQGKFPIKEEQIRERIRECVGDDETDEEG